MRPETELDGCEQVRHRADAAVHDPHKPLLCQLPDVAPHGHLGYAELAAQIRNGVVPLLADQVEDPLPALGRGVVAERLTVFGFLRHPRAPVWWQLGLSVNVLRHRPSRCLVVHRAPQDEQEAPLFE
jgi:hypothetical protein